MQKKILWIGLILAMVSSVQVKAQNPKQDSTQRKWFVGSMHYCWIIINQFSNKNIFGYFRLSEVDVKSYTTQ